MRASAIPFVSRVFGTPMKFEVLAEEPFVTT